MTAKGCCECVLSYFGHLARHELYSLKKLIAVGNVEGKHFRGWLLTQWRDQVKETVQANFTVPLTERRTIVRGLEHTDHNPEYIGDNYEEEERIQELDLIQKVDF